MVSIQGNSTSMDIGNAEFFRLRKRIAELAGEDIKNHYSKLEKGMRLPIGERNAFFIEHDMQTETLGKKYNGEKDTILDFLYAPDTDAEFSPSECRQIYALLEEYDGTEGGKDAENLLSFKQILKECVDANVNMYWY